MQLWLAFLLVCVLAGFGATVYQLQRVNRFAQIDSDLETRIAALTGAVRGLYVEQPQVVAEPDPPSNRRIKPPPVRSEFDETSGDHGPPAAGLEDGPRGFDGRGPGGRDLGGRDFDGRGFDRPGFGSRGLDDRDFGRGGEKDFHGRRPGRGPEGRGPFDGRGEPPPDAQKRAGRQPPPARIAKKPDDLELPAPTAALFGDRPGDFYYQVWYRDGSVLKRSLAAPLELTRPEAADRDTLPHLRTRSDFREALICSGMGDCVLAGRPVKADLAAMRKFKWALLLAGFAVLALGLGFSFWLTSRAIRPIEKISAAAQRIAHGNLSERVEGAGSGDELGSLAGVLNSTFSRLESAFERQRQFTSDAAHELRTPLAVIISETQTTLARERTAAEYRETVEACLDTAQQMRRLTESLLQLARFDASNDDPRCEVDVAETARRCGERLMPLAKERGISLEFDLSPARASANAERLEQVISNLLSNAIFYNQPDGSIRIATGVERNTAVITVSDTGVGIPEKDLEHIFERFYRVDKARSRAEGHTGLGLAISKAIVDAEGGTIEAQSVPGEGSTFTVRLPVKP